MPVFVDGSDLLRIVPAMDAVQARVIPAMAYRFPLLADIAGGIAVEAIRAETPVQSGALQESTESVPSWNFPVMDLSIQQPADSVPNEDESGGGHHYVQWVIGGHGPIVPLGPDGTFAPPGNPYGTGKRALANREGGFGPVRSIGAYAGYDYVLDAEPAIEAGLGDVLTVWAEGTAAAIVAGERA